MRNSISFRIQNKSSLGALLQVARTSAEWCDDLTAVDAGRGDCRRCQCAGQQETRFRRRNISTFPSARRPAAIWKNSVHCRSLSASCSICKPNSAAACCRSRQLGTWPLRSISSCPSLRNWRTFYFDVKKSNDDLDDDGWHLNNRPLED